jgi:hypothetical protein
VRRYGGEDVTMREHLYYDQATDTGSRRWAQPQLLQPLTQLCFGKAGVNRLEENRNLVCGRLPGNGRCSMSLQLSARTACGGKHSRMDSNNTCRACLSRSAPASLTCKKA